MAKKKVVTRGAESSSSVTEETDGRTLKRKTKKKIEDELDTIEEAKTADDALSRAQSPHANFLGLDGDIGQRGSVPDIVGPPTDIVSGWHHSNHPQDNWRTSRASATAGAPTMMYSEGPVRSPSPAGAQQSVAWTMAHAPEGDTIGHTRGGRLGGWGSSFGWGSKNSVAPAPSVMQTTPAQPPAITAGSIRLNSPSPSNRSDPYPAPGGSEFIPFPPAASSRPPSAMSAHSQRSASRATTPRAFQSPPPAIITTSSTSSTPQPRPSSALSANSNHQSIHSPPPEPRPGSAPPSRRSSRATSVSSQARLSFRSAQSPAPIGSQHLRSPSRTSEHHTIRDSIVQPHGEVITEVIEEEAQHEQPIPIGVPPPTPKMPYGLQPAFPATPTLKTSQPLQMSIAYRQAMTMSSPGPQRPQPTHDVRIQETGGLALKEAQRALYGRHRHATQRFYWTLPPEHDDRVSTLLDWIETMSWGLANMGLSKFLAWRNRGALVVNADFRPWRSPDEPAFDWFTFEDSQKTLDRVLQESIATYDPANTVLVFAFLVSKSGSSLGIWRRKVNIPASLQLKHGVEVERVKREIALNRPPVVKVEPPLPEDTTPIPISPPPPPKKPKRRWFFFGRKKKGV